MKKIIVYEGGQEHIFEAKKLRTPLQEGGTCDWVPEDDVQLTTKSISKNGTYNASSDDAYGYSKVTVNVSGGNGSADSHGKPTGGDIKPGGAGSAVVGTDPETGNDVVVGVDEEGNLVTTPIPSAIEIITPPTKTEYTEGETMDYNGIIVGLKKKDGTTFTDATYPNGHIPMGELIFPVEVAPEGGEQTDYERDVSGTDLVAPVYLAPLSVGMRFNNLYVTSVEGQPYGIITETSSSARHSAIVSFEPSRVVVARSGGAYPEVFDATNIYSTDDGTCYYSATQHGPGASDIPASNGANGQNAGIVGAKALIGTTWLHPGGTAEIPVQWKSPYDGKTLEDKFEITVTGTGSSHTSESSSGTEGTGGGGEF